MDLLVHSFILLNLFSCSLATHCNLLLRIVPYGGIGVFAGREWNPTELMELSVGIPVPYSSIYWTSLINYSEGYNGTHALFTLGFSALYNHISIAESSMVQKHMSGSTGLVQFGQTHERSIDVFFEPNSVIYAGDEIFSHYGDDWFADRGIEEHIVESAGSYTFIDRESTPQDNYAVQSHMHNLPGCPLQWTEYIGGILRATVNISAGSYIEVTRALLIPTWAVADAGPMTEILWWNREDVSNTHLIDENATVGEEKEELSARLQKLSKRFGSPYTVAPYNRSDSGYAVLFTGHGALYSPSTTVSAKGSLSIDNKSINVVYDWWRGAAPSTTEDVVCGLAMLVSFQASRDILEGDELVVDLAVDASGRRHPRDGFANTCL